MIKNQKYLRNIILILVFLLIVSTALAAISVWEKRESYYPITDGDGTLHQKIEYDGTKYVLNSNIETVLVMGLDKFEGDIDKTAYYNDQQADFLMLFVFDNENSTCTAIHISRDTMAEINVLGVAGQSVGKVTEQIALAHTYGSGDVISCRNTADAVSGLFCNIHIDHYLSVTMDSVAVLNDLVSGVTLTVLDDFTGIDDTLVKGEVVTLTGEHALQYIRSRYGMEDASNEARMKRQRQYLEALYEKTKQKVSEDENFVSDAGVKMLEYIVSNCSSTKLESIINKAAAYEFTGIRTIGGESVVGEKFMEFYPDEDALLKLTVELFYVPED